MFNEDKKTKKQKKKTYIKYSKNILIHFQSTHF